MVNSRSYNQAASLERQEKPNVSTLLLSEKKKEGWNNLSIPQKPAISVQEQQSYRFCIAGAGRSDPPSLWALYNCSWQSAAGFLLTKILNVVHPRCIRLIFSCRKICLHVISRGCLKWITSTVYVKIDYICKVGPVWTCITAISLVSGIRQPLQTPTSVLTGLLCSYFPDKWS